MFIRDKNIRDTLRSEYKLDVSYKVLRKLINQFNNINSVSINRDWDNAIIRHDFINYVNIISFTDKLRVEEKPPRRYHQCRNPYKYNSMDDVNLSIVKLNKEHSYKGVKCAQCKKYHIVKIWKEEEKL